MTESQNNARLLPSARKTTGGKIKMKKCSKKLISMLMALIIVLSAFPLTSFASTYITDMNSDANFGVISGSFDKYGHEMHFAKYDGKTYIVFCVQYGKTSPDGSTYKYGSEFKKYVNREGDTYEKIAEYIAFGYTLQHGDGLPNTKQEWIDACCTQQFVWETLGVNPSRSSWDSSYMNDDLFTKWKKSTKDLMDDYYNKLPSFNGDTKNLNLGSSVTVNDSNGVMKYYPTFSKTIDKVTFSHTKGENKLTIAAADNCNTHSVNFKSSTEKIYKGLPNGNNYSSNMNNYNVVFPVVDMVLAILFFVKVGTAYFDYKKHGQFEFTAPAILFACLIFTLTAPLYIWGIVGM